MGWAEFKRSAARCGGATGVVLLSAGAAFSDLAELRANFLAAPDDPVAVTAYADAAVADGDVASAINALERILRFDPANDDIRAKIGALYAMIGQSGMMEDAADDAAAPSPTPETTVSGFVAFGLGYDTNPEAIPKGDAVSFTDGAGGFQDVPLDVEREESPIFFTQGALRLNAPVAGAAFVVDLSAYVAHFPETTDQDFVSADLRAGPFFEIEDGLLRPFVETSYLHYGGEYYGSTIFGGVEAYLGLTPQTGVGFEIAGGYRDHANTALNTDRTDMNGAEARGSVTVFHDFDDRLSAELTAYAGYLDARTGDESRAAFGVDGSVSLALGPQAPAGDLTLLAGAGLGVALYDAADLTFSSEAREDVQTTAFVGASLALTDSVSVDALIAYRRTFSNYDIYDTDGFRATLRAGVSF